MIQEVAGSRREQFEAFCQHVGMTQVQIQVVQLLRSEFLLVTLHTRDLPYALRELTNSTRPFEYWLREQFQRLLGWSFQEALPNRSHDLIFLWPGDSVDPP
ncbi:hypothetical protein KSZ_06760 [Dictyobacter formicarum]|uniref:Uncharacterized protein n=1 Tax=Dictyobacter formicarum TaxID=2778368 RepID=A0ABQ3V970_9CHLR|nr:hypothetical protein KSZ_06760 [Dictyobacter formicarum]